MIFADPPRGFEWLVNGATYMGGSRDGCALIKNSVVVGVATALGSLNVNVSTNRRLNLISAQL